MTGKEEILFKWGTSDVTFDVNLSSKLSTFHQLLEIFVFVHICSCIRCYRLSSNTFLRRNESKDLSERELIRRSRETMTYRIKLSIRIRRGKKLVRNLSVHVFCLCKLSQIVEPCSPYFNWNFALRNNGKYLISKF